MAERRDGAGEAMAREAAKREGAAERKEKFPEVDAAMRAYESAVEEREAVIGRVRRAASEGHQQEMAKGKVLDWATNLIPGVSSVKAGIDSMRMGGAFGSFKYSSGPYQPTSFSEAVEGMRSYVGLSLVAKESGLGDELKQAEQALRQAEKGLEQALSDMTPEEQLALMEAQQKMFDRK